MSNNETKTLTAINPFVDFNRWIEANKEAVYDYLLKNDQCTSKVDGLGFRAYNMLRLSGLTQISSFVLKTKEEYRGTYLEDDPVALAEVLHFSYAWLRERRGEIVLFVEKANYRREQTLTGAAFEAPQIQAEPSEKADLLFDAYSRTFKESDEADFLALADDYHHLPPQQQEELGRRQIEVLGLSNRSFNGLRRSGVDTVEKLIDLLPNGLSRIRNLGTKSIQEIKQAVANYCYKWIGGELPHAQAPIRGSDHFDEADKQSFFGRYQIFWNAISEQEKKQRKEAAEKALSDRFILAAARSFAKENDVSTNDLFLSVRSFNALGKDHIKSVSALLEVYPDDLKKIKNLGFHSYQEIVDRIDSFFLMNKDLIEEKRYSTPDAVEEAVMIRFDGIGFKGLSFNDMKAGFPSFVEEQEIKNAIGRLIHKGRLEYVDYRCYKKYPSFYERLQERSGSIKEDHRECLLRRLQGETMEEIARSFGVTKERVRQICLKQIRLMTNSQTFGQIELYDEDYYGTLFTKYKTDKEFWLEYLCVPRTTYYFLNTRYTAGGMDLEKAVEDVELDLALKFAVIRYLSRNLILMPDGTSVPRSKAAVEDYYLSKYCQDEISFSEFVDRFTAFVNENALSDQKITFSSEEAPTRKNRLSQSGKCLWKQGERLRYYDISSRDYGDLLETINLDRFQNTEISTLKFIEDYPDIMERYDIRDQYELHNLLKKLFPNGGFHDLHFGRQPVIRFGECDREKMFYEILCAVSPVSIEEYIGFIHMETGFGPETILGSPAMQKMMLYEHNGVFSIDFKHPSEENAVVLKETLTGDFYYFDEIKKTYCSSFPGADPEEINPLSLKSLGFSVYSGYVIQNHPSADAFFNDLLTKQDVFEITEYKKKFANIVLFNQILNNLRRRYELFVFDRGKQCVSFRRLSAAGISKEDIYDFCRTTAEFVKEDELFTIHSLRQNGFSFELDELGFDDTFYSGILSVHPSFCSQHVFGHVVLKRASEQRVISKKDVLLNALRSYDSVEINDFIQDFKKTYGIEIPNRYEIKEAIEGTDYYYDPVMEKIYSDKDRYYADIEEKEEEEY